MQASAKLHYPRGATDWRLAVFASLLLHIGVGCAVVIWLPRRPPAPTETEQPFEIVFQAPAERAAPELLPPPVEAAPAPREPPTPPPAEQNEAPPPAPPAPPAPPVQEALAMPPVPALPTPLAEQPPEALQKPLLAPALPPPVRPRSHPVARPQQAAPQPTPLPAPALVRPIAPPPAAPAAPPSTAADPGWRSQLSAWLAAHKSYPEEARRRSEQGNVVLRFVVERSGRVAEVAVVRGSGSSILDAAAEALLHNAILPAFPSAMSQPSVVVTVQLHFALTE